MTREQKLEAALNEIANATAWEFGWDALKAAARFQQIAKEALDTSLRRIPLTTGGLSDEELRDWRG